MSMASDLEDNACSTSAARTKRRVPAVSASPTAKTRKLRASCDACYLAKVKCSKKTTPCTRCSSHGVTCQYSPSRRVGKPRRLPVERHTAKEPTQSVGSDTAGDHIMVSSNDLAVDAPFFDWNYSPAIASSHDHGYDHFNVSPGLSFPWQQDQSHIPNHRRGSGIPTRDSNLGSPDRSRLAREPLNNRGSHSDIDSSQPPINGLQTPQWTSRSPSGLGDELNLLQGDLARLSETSSAAVKTPTSDTTVPFCTCATTTFEILRTLYDRSTSSQTPFDTILATNKDAVGRASNLLACTCTGDPTYIMILAATITKMMAWYQSICRMPAQPISISNTPPTTIVLGAYRLDGEDEDAVKMQVVLNELKKVDLLMAKFAERFRALQVQQESTFYGELIMFLRRKLREVVGELQRDLKMEFADVA